jgi:hypothetical protein
VSEPEIPSPTLADVTARLDDLLREVRRQGRAAVAAQAAAEQCLEALERAPEKEAEAEPEPEPARGVAWLRALLPIADAVDRIAAQAAATAERRARPQHRRFWLFPRAPEPGDPEVAALSEGLRVLRAQLAAVLGGLGVTVDRDVGVPVDAERHRVVEVRERRTAVKSTVVEVVRPGYALDGRIVREAEVVATGQPARTSEERK